MRKRTISIAAAAVTGALIMGTGVVAANAVQNNVYRSCTQGRHHYGIVDQTGWGSMTFQTSGEVLTIVQPALVRSTRYKHGAQHSGYVLFDASTAIHSSIIECSL
ncbi:hypothetical protein [Microbacterium rhizomatis]|uniref:Secreted protein n=1 Tax=Microbacterium rhizomatis TaxID=1631477 RepID=A0A5J5IV89_9MICO|nr:hypothetical protein [Microbacterium rhizomatis]KAA9104537.1 hypothetical protein F6B43_19410 [Microbacterium rhizomatis]